MSSHKRISLRTPQLHGEYSSLLRGLVYEHLDPSERNHVTDSQFLRQTRYQSHNGSKSHIIRTLSHTLTHTRTHFSHTIDQNIPSSHRRTQTTTFFIQASVRSVHAHERAPPRIVFCFEGARKGMYFGFFAVQEEENRWILHACMDGHIYPAATGAETRNYHILNPLFFSSM